MKKKAPSCLGILKAGEHLSPNVGMLRVKRHLPVRRPFATVYRCCNRPGLEPSTCALVHEFRHGQWMCLNDGTHHRVTDFLQYLTVRYAHRIVQIFI